MSEIEAKPEPETNQKVERNNQEMKDGEMTQPETNPQEPTPIELLFTGHCPSLSGRSTLSFAIGRHPDGSLQLRIVGNSGGGMFCDEWASGSAIDEVVSGATALTSRSFDGLHPGRSINTAGFILAVLKHLGLIRANSANSRLKEHVPTMTFEKGVMALMGQAKNDSANASPIKPARRKGKEAL